VTFHAHLSHVLRLSIAQYSRSVLNNVCIATIRTSSREYAHRRRISGKRCIQSALFTASWSALCRFTCITSDPPEEAFRGRRRRIRVRLPPKLPKRADAGPQVLGRELSEGIAHKRHMLERDLDQRGITVLLWVPEQRRTSARCMGLGQNEVGSGVKRRVKANAANGGSASGAG